MDHPLHYDSIPQLVKEVRAQTRNAGPHFEDLATLRAEIRTRRKSLIRSDIPLELLIQVNSEVNEMLVDEVSRYLASRTLVFWRTESITAEEFCLRFYTLALYAIGSGEVGDESVDDIIQLAECLVRSRKVFVTVMKNLLPKELIGELFEFTESYDNRYYTSAFEDAVLGAVSVFLGALSDPLDSKRES